MLAYIVLAALSRIAQSLLSPPALLNHQRRQFTFTRCSAICLSSSALFLSGPSSGSDNILTSYNLRSLSNSFVYKPSRLSLSPNDHNNHGSITNDGAASPPPLVILIGWFNSTPRYFRHYASIYTDTFNVDTLSHIPPSYNAFVPWTIMPRIRRLAKDLLTFWSTNGRPEVGFHVFSNNGAYHYALLCEAIREIDSRDATLFLQSIKSCVVDSAPSPINPKYVALGISGGFLRPAANPAEKAEIKPPSILVRLLSFYFSLEITKRYQNFAHQVLENVPDARYLFIYGREDQIVPSTEVERYMQVLKSRGVREVTGKMFLGKSDHVQHFLRHPNEYVDSLRRFYEYENDTKFMDNK